MKQYSFINTNLLINGVSIEGWDEGDDVITLERINDSALHKVGVDGEMTVAISADRSGRMTFRLNQSSDTHPFLTGLITAQENGLFVPIFAQFKDTVGSDFGSGTQGYIPRPANMVRGNNSNPQEWMVVVERLDLLHAGGFG